MDQSTPSISPDEEEDLFSPGPSALPRVASPGPLRSPTPGTPEPYVPTLDADAQRDLAAAHTRLGDALPATGWLAEFVQLATPMTSAPVEFHLASGLAALSAALGNRIRMRRWNTSIYPHLWQLVVAPSSRWHKTTSINMARELLAKSGLDPLYPAEFSRESLLAEFATKPAGLLIFGEFASFLNTARRDYGQGLPANLTDLYDGPDEWKRTLKSTGELVIRRPAIGIYGTTTIDWLEQLVTPADLRAGFYYRFLFVTAAMPNTDRTFATEIDAAGRNRLIEGLHNVAQIGRAATSFPGADEPTTVQLSAEAERLWAGWVNELHHEADHGNHPASVIGFTERLQTNGLKVAMLYRASACAVDRREDPLLVDVPAMRAAIAWGRLVWSNITQLFENDWAGDREARSLRRVQECVGNGCTRAEALRRSHMRARDFDQYLDTLVQSDVIVREHRIATELGLTRERPRPIEWLRPGAKHPTVLAARRAGRREADPTYRAELERALLGVLVWEPGSVRRAQEVLDEHSWAEPRHRAIWSACCELVQEAEALDPGTVALALQRAGRLAEAGGVAYVGGLLSDPRRFEANLAWLREELKGGQLDAQGPARQPPPATRRTKAPSDGDAGSDKRRMEHITPLVTTPAPATGRSAPGLDAASDELVHLFDEVPAPGCPEPPAEPSTEPPGGPR